MGKFSFSMPKWCVNGLRTGSSSRLSRQGLQKQPPWLEVWGEVEGGSLKNQRLYLEVQSPKSRSGLTVIVLGGERSKCKRNRGDSGGRECGRGWRGSPGVFCVLQEQGFRTLLGHHSLLCMWACEMPRFWGRRLTQGLTCMPTNAVIWKVWIWSASLLKWGLALGPDSKDPSTWRVRTDLRSLLSMVAGAMGAPGGDQGVVSLLGAVGPGWLPRFSHVSAIHGPVLLRMRSTWPWPPFLELPSRSPP